MTPFDQAFMLKVNSERWKEAQKVKQGEWR